MATSKTKLGVGGKGAVPSLPQSRAGEPGSAVSPADSSSLSIWTKGIYGAGYFGQTVVQNAFYVGVMLFYTDVVRLSSQFAGIALAIGRVFDGLTNPLMGQISDRTQTRLGRRRPYIMLGGVLWGFIFILLWLASPRWAGGTKFAYLVLVDILFAIGGTVFIVPYMALGAELSLDYDERSSIAAYRIAFMQIGQIVGAGMLPLTYWIKDEIGQWEGVSGQNSGQVPHVARLLALFPNAEWGLAAIILAAISVLSMFLSGLVPRERFATRWVIEFTPWQAFRTTLSNANFRRVVATYVTFHGISSLGNFVLPYLLIYYVEKPSYIMPLYASGALSGVLSLPLWLRLGRSLEKSVVLRIVCVYQALLGPLAFVLFSPSYPALMFLLGIWGGAGQAAFETYCYSLLGDVTDEDELRTGRRREGMYFGVHNLLLKLAISVGLVWSGFALALVKYTPGAQQTGATLLGMRLLYAIPFLSLLFGTLYLRRYSLDRARLETIHREIRTRNCI